MKSVTLNKTNVLNFYTIKDFYVEEGKLFSELVEQKNIFQNDWK